MESELTATSHQLTATSSQLTATSSQLAAVVAERDNLRRAYRQLMEQFELLRRRIFIAKAERVDSTQLELEFARTKQQLDALAEKLGEVRPSEGTGAGDAGSRPSGKPPKTGKSPPRGRRNLADCAHLPERRVELRDPELESKGQFIGWETSYKLGYQRPEAVRVVIARAKYKVAVEAQSPSSLPSDATVIEQDGERFTILTAPLPRLLLRRGLLAPSMLAHIIRAEISLRHALLPSGGKTRGRRYRPRPQYDGALRRRGRRRARRDRAHLRR
jgi:hypothetical protein